MLLGLVLKLAFGWWWADSLAGYVIVYYAIRESIDIFRCDPPQLAADPTTQTSDPGALEQEPTRWHPRLRSSLDPWPSERLRLSDRSVAVLTDGDKEGGEPR